MSEANEYETVERLDMHFYLDTSTRNDVKENLIYEKFKVKNLKEKNWLEMTKLNNKHLFDKQKSTFEEMAMFDELSKKCIDGHKI